MRKKSKELLDNLNKIVAKPNKFEKPINIPNIIVDVGGSGYTNGDVVSVNNANTNGAGLVAEVAMVNGGISPEAGDLVGEWGVELETATVGAPGDIELEAASGTGLIKQEEAYDMLAIDHIVLEDFTVFNDGY